MNISPLTALPVVGDLLKTALPVVGDAIKAVAPLIQPFADAIAKKIGAGKAQATSQTIEFSSDANAQKLSIKFTQ
ncbi:hypothetical protein GIW41_22595 [Pseudomonas sp. PA-6-1D]|uniref:hypothetical protein n=1 Tax=Pseudomonas TaxID=286 RepID=UPI001EF06ADF|nr:MULTISPECIES: hypothetical protein [Pseudomonas]MCF5144055.1 hypothetical protein [Pseudomonas sp. PA-6-3C]MCF5148356.1 hypothetical protein [Pseudomonas sp. PA-6-3F]MCF5158581.1 hypothetical protein [Pseudomonas sp. PA-6-2E]MCF5178055.1 hypothetical protein [Pseudomonas sp. PA-6-1D]MCF5193771.1 hypothetical protein [Pseudomonas sp. PA-6-1H]